MDSLIHLLADAIWPPFVFSLLIGLPSVFLYLAELGAVFRNWRKFNSSFFVLFVVRGISHTTNYFASFLYQRFGKLGVFLALLQSLPSPVLNTLFFANFYFFHVENLSNFFLLLNRLSAVLFLMDYGKIWRWAIPFAVAITFLLPLSITAHIFWLDMSLSFDEHNHTFVLNYTYPSYYKRWPLVWRKGNTFLCMVSALAFLVICLAINVATISVMRWKTAAEVANREVHRMERRMTIYALVTFLGQFTVAVYMILQYVIASPIKHDPNIDEDLRQEMIVATQNQFCWVNDLATVALPAWLLLWASPSLRLQLHRELLASLWCPQSSCWRRLAYQMGAGQQRRGGGVVPMRVVLPMRLMRPFGHGQGVPNAVGVGNPPVGQRSQSRGGGQKRQTRPSTAGPWTRSCRKAVRSTKLPGATRSD